MRKNTFLILSVLAVIILAACGGPAGDEGAELGDRGLYNIALKYIEEEEYKAAINVLNTIETNFPNSVIYKDARLKRALSLFLQKTRPALIEAEAEYKAYITLYPTDANLDYVQKQIGLCHWMRKRSYKNDPTEVKKAIVEFEYFMKKYPDSKYREEVSNYLTEAKNYMAEHHSYVADFYLEIEKYKAAQKRYEQAVEMAQGTENLAKYNIKYLKTIIPQRKKELVEKVSTFFISKREELGSNSEVYLEYKKLMDEWENVKDLPPVYSDKPDKPEPKIEIEED